MKIKHIIIFLLLLLVIIPTSYYAHSHIKSHPQALNIIADDALQLVKQEKYVEAKNLLDIFSDEFTKAMLKQPNMPMDEVRVITIVHNESVAAIADVALPHEEKVRAATSLRLAVDAMTSEHQPLWTEMEESIISAFHQLKDAIETRDRFSYQEVYHRLLLKYDMIRPSLRMDVKPEIIQKVDAHFEYLDQHRDQFLTYSKIDELAVMEADLKALFRERKEDEADPALLWVMISTGSIILLTLSYVGWRKYDADRKKAKRKKLID